MVVGEVDYFSKDRGGVIDWQRNGTFLKEGYYTQIGNEAVKFVESGVRPAVLPLLRLACAPRALQARRTTLIAIRPSRMRSDPRMRR